MNVYYCVLKNYKGTFEKKHKGNTHLFFVPITNDEYLYLGLLGEIVDDSGVYATQLILRTESHMVDPLIDGEEEHFGERFLVLDELSSSTKQTGESTYLIKVSKNGTYIKSDLELSYDHVHSTDKQKLYLMEGTLNFESEDIDDSHDLRMMGMKQMAFMGDLNRFSTFKKK